MKEYLVCIDSDGCAIDSMEIKHRTCFGPCLIDEWHLEKYENEILDLWNNINLYSKTRGINRFLGLKIILSEINSSFISIDGIDDYCLWCENTNSFSNDTVKKQFEATDNEIFKKALSWSERVNKKIESIRFEIKPFDGVREALEVIGSKADIAIVSSANSQAVNDEWTRFGLMEYVNYVMAQDAGTKSDCISRLIKSGYSPEKTLMVGDAPGDEKAAIINNVHYFQIVPKEETKSWTKLKEKSIVRFFNNCYDNDNG
ncbi:MAG: HAD family hydrolase [Eubacterium sp.]